jgi:hypothetical protein
MCPSPDTSARAPPSLQWVLWPPLAGALQFPAFIGTMRFYDGSSIHGRTSTVSLDVRFAPLSSEKWRALMGSWAIPVDTCPGLETPATPARPRSNGRCRILPSAEMTASASQRDKISELNPHGLLPNCVRFTPTSRPVNGNTRF